ncbi:MAG: GNAT family N-acetyltransferase [Rhodobacterales bacterium]|nr:GNAT family N-acetyltransferase [Rhodobacterales bacterium]
MQEKAVEIQILTSLAQIDAQEWDACANPCGDARPTDPFTTHRFLIALEDSGSVGEGTGWQPHYLVARLDGKVIAVAPMYGKSHSQGEYIFDHNWAHGYEHAGGKYYPKLQIAVPFTPATGRRLLTRSGYEEMGQSALIQGAIQVAAENHLSSLHITFCTANEATAGVEMGLLRRTSQQFHWVNQDYQTFDGFLASLSSRKRKSIRKERARANDFGGEILCLTGDEILPEHWDAFWHFYQDTGARKWGTPYLTRAFFDIAHRDMRDDILLVLARRDGKYVAGALNFIGKSSLYGRYWGCVEDHPYLHFELCYYRAIDFAIDHKLATVEAGAQGEHKLSRGYLPVETHSLHWISDPGFRDAVAKSLEAERKAVEEDIEVLTAYGPFKKVNPDEHS